MHGFDHEHTHTHTKNTWIFELIYIYCFNHIYSNPFIMLVNSLFAFIIELYSLYACIHSLFDSNLARLITLFHLLENEISSAQNYTEQLTFKGISIEPFKHLSHKIQQCYWFPRSKISWKIRIQIIDIQLAKHNVY